MFQSKWHLAIPQCKNLCFLTYQHAAINHDIAMHMNSNSMYEKPFYILVQKQFFIVRYFCFHINKHVLTQEETSFSFSIFKGLKTLRDISVGSNLSKEALKLIKNWQSEMLHCHKNILNKCCYFIYIYIYQILLSKATYSGYTFCCLYVCSLGIEPTTFCAVNTMLYHWATGTLYSIHY